MLHAMLFLLITAIVSMNSSASIALQAAASTAALPCNKHIFVDQSVQLMDVAQTECQHMLRGLSTECCHALSNSHVQKS